MKNQERKVYIMSEWEMWDAIDAELAKIGLEIHPNLQDTRVYSVDVPAAKWLEFATIASKLNRTTFHSAHPAQDNIIDFDAPKEQVQKIRESIGRLESNPEFESDINYLFTLKYRWADEKDYEDFADYIKAAKRNVKSFSITKMHKSFAVFFTLNGIDLKLKLNSRSYSFTTA